MLEKLAPPSPVLIPSSEEDYYTQFCKFARRASTLAPVGLQLLNEGTVTATGIKVVLKAAATLPILMLPQKDYPLRPRKKRGHIFQEGGLFASHIKPDAGDIVVTREDNRYQIEWSIEKAIPHLAVKSDGSFLVATKKPCEFELDYTIFGENLAEPVRGNLTIDLQCVEKDFTADEIRNFSDTLAKADAETRRGKVA